MKQFLFVSMIALFGSACQSAQNVTPNKEKAMQTSQTTSIPDTLKPGQVPLIRNIQIDSSACTLLCASNPAFHLSNISSALFLTPGFQLKKVWLEDQVLRHMYSPTFGLIFPNPALSFVNQLHPFATKVFRILRDCYLCGPLNYFSRATPQFITNFIRFPFVLFCYRKRSDQNRSSGRYCYCFGS